MKLRILAIVAGMTGLLAIARGDGPPVPAPADFKLTVDSFGAGKEPVYTDEIVVRLGRIYVISTLSKEVTIIEPSLSTLDILDIGRRVQTEITFRRLDEGMVKLKASLLTAVEKLEKEGGRGKLIEARMTRDLFETPLEVSADAKLNRVKLKDPAVEVDAEGEPEADAARLAYVNSALVNIARLGAYRTPNDLPPFVELETIAALTEKRKLRPISITYLYRLAGPPRKMRRTYKLVPTLTAREMEAISRVDKLRAIAPSLRYDQYRTDR